MDELKQFIDQEIKILRPDGGKPRTGDVRKISAKVYKQIKHLDLDEVLDICEGLLEERKWAYGVIAYDNAFRQKDHYTIETFDRFEHWLFAYVRDWNDCDDFGTHALGALLLKFEGLYPKVLKWCDHKDFWVRRMAAVVLIYPVYKGGSKDLNPFTIADRLLTDDHYLVLKGYGWLLKVYGMFNPKEVEDYIIKNKDEMPRVAFRYAIEKLEPDVRKKLMKL